ncbi:hypothetical protein CHU98_g4211 [Xylaria longipes]|nr:hypothetical protein CHU98_g4211 [Xylaria longipes]
MDNGIPLQSSGPIGYGAIADAMGADDDLLMFRRFASLNARNLLYLQAELSHLESRLLALDLTLDKFSKGLAGWEVPRSWDKMTGSEEGKEHLELVNEIRRKLEQYSKKGYYSPRFKLSFLESGVLELSGPSEDRRRTRGILNFSSTSRVRGFVRILAVIASSLLPVLSIVVLYYIQSQSARLIAIVAFSAFCSLALTVLTDARNAEIIATTAAFQKIFNASSYKLSALPNRNADGDFVMRKMRIRSGYSTVSRMTDVLPVMGTEMLDVIVVGTGWNGLISAKTYLDFAPNANLVLLDDQSSIGGVWCKEKIYPSLYAQIKYGLFEYSFYPMRKEGITPDGYISGDTINKYLNGFAQDFDLVRRIRLRTKVVRVNRLDRGGWILDLDGKPSIQCAKLIYASGATSHPVIPSWPMSNDFGARIIHSSELGMHLDALEKIHTVTVVGAAKSAYDTVFHLLNSGKRVNWVIREDGSGPLAIMPPTILGIFNTMDAVATRIVAMMGSSIMKTEGAAYKTFQKTWLGRAVANGFWLTLTAIAESHAGYARSTNAQKLRPVPHGNGIFWANAGLGAASVPDYWKVFHAGDCTVHRSEIESLEKGSLVNLRNGIQFRADYVILCTGFDKSYQPFDQAL